jgi:hypothetical protein
MVPQPDDSSQYRPLSELAQVTHPCSQFLYLGGSGNIVPLFSASGKTHFKCRPAILLTTW